MPSKYLKVWPISACEINIKRIIERPEHDGQAHLSWFPNTRKNGQKGV